MTEVGRTGVGWVKVREETGTRQAGPWPLQGRWLLFHPKET